MAKTKRMTKRMTKREKGLQEENTRLHALKLELREERDKALYDYGIAKRQLQNAETNSQTAARELQKKTAEAERLASMADHNLQVISHLQDEVHSLRSLLRLSIDKSNYPTMPGYVTTSEHSTEDKTIFRPQLETVQ